MLKRIILSAVFSLFVLSVNAGGIYPDYLYDNPNYPIVTGRMGSAVYIDKTSATSLLNTDDEFIAAATFIRYNVDKSEQGNPYTVFFYQTINPRQRDYKKMHINGYTMTLPPYEKGVYYTSFDYGATWHKFPLKPKIGPEVRQLSQLNMTLKHLVLNQNF